MKRYKSMSYGIEQAAVLKRIHLSDGINYMENSGLQLGQLGEKIPPNFLLFHLLAYGFRAPVLGNIHLGDLL